MTPITCLMNFYGRFRGINLLAAKAPMEILRGGILNETNNAGQGLEV
jgi:hypothetical protein